KPVQAGAWSTRPQFNCAGGVNGAVNADGTTISFDLGGVVVDGNVDVALVPGNGAAVLPPSPVPGAPAPPQPSGFDVTFQPVTADQVRTAPGAAPSAAGTGIVPAPIDVAAPSNDVPATDFSAPATDFNFAANAVQPSAGVAASSTPSVSPGSLAPQTR